MKLCKVFLLFVCLLANVIKTDSHKSPKFPRKHILKLEIGVGDEMPKRITEDPEKRKLYGSSHPFKIHVDTSNVRDGDAETREYLVNLIAKHGNKIFEEKIGISGYQTVQANSRLSRYCNYEHIVSVPDKFMRQDTNADFILLLATDDTGDDGTLAYATACFTERRTGRPNVGLAVFNPYYLNPGEGKLDNHVATYVHEVLHALGFSSQLWKTFPLNKNGQKQYVVSNKKHYLRGDNLLNTVRDHFDCQKIQGVPLEDDGGEGSAGGHLERIIFGDETMVSEDVEIAKFSKMTLALLKDSGWYDIDLGKGDHYTWGKGEGCDLFYKRCGTASVEETCSQNNNFGCDKTFKYKMSCKRTVFTGDCNIKTKGKSCAKGQDDLYFFESTGTSSRCQEFFYKGTKMAGCVEIRCNSAKTMYQVSLKGQSPKKFVCKRENEIKKTWTGFEFVCENPKIICRDLCPKSCYNRGKCLENGECSCDPFFGGEICGTFKGCMGLSRALCYKVVKSNKLNYKSYSNDFTSNDFDPNYLQHTSWTDYYNRYLVQTDTGI